MRRRALVLGALAVLVVSLGGFGLSGFMKVSRLMDEVHALERDLTTLRARSETLARAIECLRTDPLCIERWAREDLGMVREGEIILKFPSERAR